MPQYSSSVAGSYSTNKQKRPVCYTGYANCHFQSSSRHDLPNIYASVNSSTCAQHPPGDCRVFARLVNPGDGAFANFALPVSRTFANPGAIPELLARTRFPIRI